MFHLKGFAVLHWTVQMHAFLNFHYIPLQIKYMQG